MHFSPVSTEELIKRNGLGFRSTYNDEQTNKILATVNNSTLIELKNFEISAMRIKKLMQRRESMGEYKAVEDLLELDGFGVKVLEKFCNSVLNSEEIPSPNENIKSNEIEQHKIDEEDDFKKKFSFVSPALIETVRLGMSTVVSFHIDTNYIAWTKFSYNRGADDSIDEPRFIVENWNCYEIDNQDKRTQLSDLIEVLVQVNGKIPDADVYVMESLQPAINSRQPGAMQVNLFIQKRQLFAMLAVLMALRRSASKLVTNQDALEEKQPRYLESVYFLRHFLPSRFYKILVGTERVSSGDVVNKIINYNHEALSPNFDPTCTSIFIPDECRYHWKNSDRIKQEYIGISTLTGLTFLKLCVHKCRQSIASVNRKVKN